jgi:hypothetical protein
MSGSVAPAWSHFKTLRRSVCFPLLHYWNKNAQAHPVDGCPGGCSVPHSANGATPVKARRSAKVISFRTAAGQRQMPAMVAYLKETLRAGAVPGRISRRST